MLGCLRWSRKAKNLELFDITNRDYKRLVSKLEKYVEMVQNARPDLKKLREPKPKAKKLKLFGSSFFSRFEPKHRSVVKEYLAKSFGDKDLEESSHDPLAYWRSESANSALRLVFYALLPLDCSNAGAEGTFSDLRNLVTDNRSRFTSHNVNIQLTSRSMLKHLKRINNV